MPALVESPPETQGYLEVPVDALAHIQELQVDLFIRHSESNRFVLFREAGFAVNSLFADPEILRGHQRFYIPQMHSAPVVQQLYDCLDEIVSDDSISCQDRFLALQTAVELQCEYTLSLVDSTQYVSFAQNAAKQVSHLIASGDIGPRDLFLVAKHDYSTFIHVTNVAAYVVMLAQRMGIADQDELHKIAVGGMLHDLGKRAVPLEILNKPASLTPEERAVIETHPQRGYEELHDHDDLGFGQLMMVYQHHERIDGTGYPVRILGDEIHPWAKLLAVVDVFDALTGRRPYRKAATREEALAFLDSRAGTHFDAEIVACWKTALQPAN